MQELKSMGSTGTAFKKAPITTETDPDSVVVPIHLPKRLPFRPTIPASKLKRIVFRVVRERQARELAAAEALRNAKAQ